MQLTVSIKLIQDAYLQIYNTCVTSLERQSPRVFPLYVTSTLQHVYFKNFIGIHFIIPLFDIIKLLTCILIVKERPPPQYSYIQL